MANTYALQNQPGHHTGYDATVEEDSIRRSAGSNGRPRPVHSIESAHTWHIPLHTGENQFKER